jgi:predicted TIM-barrel fold metal-dependent hydrolase
VIDAHLHARRTLEANVAHMDGCGVRACVLLARDTSGPAVRSISAAHPGRFAWAAATDIAAPDAEARLTAAAKAGASAFGEMKFHLAADAPEFQRVYALAGEMSVPILVHFQEVEHFAGEGLWATGFKQFEAMLKKFRDTMFIGHADAFWANVDAKYAEKEAYPTGPIARGGITDKLLGDYANLFGDLSANSGNNALSRDPSFTPDFLRRHQDKLQFGSDCGCADGRGTGIAQSNNPGASRLAGKCVARETLGLLQRSTTPEVFRKLTWDNAHRLFKLDLLIS